MTIFTKAIERMREKIWEGEGISDLPDTREFLDAKGVQSIRDLDEQGMRELRDYLQHKLESIKSPDSIH